MIIVTSVMIRDQLSELYIWNKRNFDFGHIKFIQPHQKNTIHFENTKPNISVTEHDV